MIVDRLENCARYEYLSPHLREGFRYLLNFDHGTPDGRVDLRGADCYALIQTFVPCTPDQRQFEAHLSYFDVQCVFQGAELLQVEPVGRLTAATAYDKAKDITFYRDPPVSSSIVLQPGDYAIFLPEDAHKTSCIATGTGTVRKVVLKLRLKPAT